MRTKVSERGQAMVLIAFIIVGLIGITGLVVDGGMAFANRRQAQNAADASVMAAALARVRGADYITAGIQQARENGFNNDGEQSEVQVLIPPASGPYAGNAQYVQVVIVSHQRTFFGSVVGIRTVTNTVEAVARAKPAEWSEIMDGFAVISLAPSSNCQNDKAFWAHGEATLELEGGGLWINSNNPTCAFLQQGNGSVAFKDSSAFIIVGGASIQKPQMIQRQMNSIGYMQKNAEASIAIQPLVGAVPVPYPPPFVLPKPACGANVAKVKEDGLTMTPGNWDEDFPPEGVTHLDSGIYCLNAGIHTNGNTTLDGTGVVLYVEHGDVRFNGSATLDLAAPSSGPFAGLLMYLPMENDSIVVMNGNSQSKFRGTILAPASLIRLAGNDSSYGFHSQIIGYYIELSGDSKLVVKYIDSQNYDAVISPSIEMTQ
jgi:hypothetical protein